MENKERNLPVNLEKCVIYQVFLRAFTLEGTLKAAERLLPHLADLKVDIIYLCPVVEADDDANQELWSERQLMSKSGNPKNTYRMKDYYKIDEEYGTDDDLRDFIDTAHSLGLKVMLDLVYLHCGPNAVFIKEHPDFVKRDEDGNIMSGPWHFPLINYESNELREYLWDNMEYFVKKFDVDGYRCDVGDQCPLDFWLEGRKRLEKINPNIIMLNEGINPEYVVEAFHINYNFEWSAVLLKVMKGELPASAINEYWNKHFDEYKIGSKFIRALDTHDIASDSYDNRIEKAIGSDAVESALLMNHTLDGVPFIYNGYEVADEYKHNMFSNRFYARDIAINWSNALTEKGKRRLDFIKTINGMRHENHALAFGDVSWLKNSDEASVVSFSRNSEEQNIAVIINTKDSVLSVNVDVNIRCAGDIKPILNKSSRYTYSKEGLKVDMLPYSYLVIEY